MTTAPTAPPAEGLRLSCANREGVTPVPTRLDAILPADHTARLIWDALTLLDLTAFYASVRVSNTGPGRSAIDPKLLLALWVYATAEGESSARHISELCVCHLGYMWLCGGVTVNYHTLSDFRVQHAAAMEALFTELVGHLLVAGLVDLEHVAQDGLRVRASAGAASFRRQPTLEAGLVEAQAVWASLPATSDTPTKPQAAQARAARERVAHLEAALAAMPAARAAKQTETEKAEARVSTTDADARVMKMADGGFRPAYNFQFAADTQQRVIVGVDVTTQGSDMGQAVPMVAQVGECCGQLPDDWLMDGGYSDLRSIDRCQAKGVRVLAPVRASKIADRDPHTPRPDDSPAVAAWRARMATDEAKATYKLRAATIECVNAHARGRFGLQQLLVRGLAKVKCVAYWIASTHNLLLWIKQRQRACVTP